MKKQNRTRDVGAVDAALRRHQKSIDTLFTIVMDGFLRHAALLGVLIEKKRLKMGEFDELYADLKQHSEQLRATKFDAAVRAELLELMQRHKGTIQ